MRTTIARALLSLMLIASVGVAWSACRHTAEGAKKDIHRDTK
jgi:predicted small secreted protein